MKQGKLKHWKKIPKLTHKVLKDLQKELKKNAWSIIYDPFEARYSSLEYAMADMKESCRKRNVKPLDMVDGKPAMNPKYRDAPFAIVCLMWPEVFSVKVPRK